MRRLFTFIFLKFLSVGRHSQFTPAYTEAGEFAEPSPHFSRTDYCGGEYIRPDSVMLLRPPRRTVEYDCGDLGRMPCQSGVFTASLRNPVRN
ncbi:MAG: hypothetical protein ABIJ42_01290, partial [Acidobacteriota bacterium]